MCWIYLLFVLVTVSVLWLLQNLVHGLSHVSNFAKYHNTSTLLLKFWPHRYAGRWYSSRFATSYTGSAYDINPIVWIAPLITAIWQLVFWHALFFVAVILGITGWFVLTALFLTYVIPGVDALFWVWGYHFGSELCDGKKYRRLKEVEAKFCTQ